MSQAPTIAELKRLKTFDLPESADAAMAFINDMAELSEDNDWEGDFDAAADWGYEDADAIRMFASPKVYNHDGFQALARKHSLKEVK
jgi:hypothetical protein